MKQLILFILLVYGFGFTSKANPPEDGKAIFLSRCASCHNVNKVIVGPALGGVEQRRQMNWIVSFVQSSQTVISSGDKDARSLFEKFGQVVMPDHKDLSEGDVKSIVAYISAEAKANPVSKAPFAKPDRLHPSWSPLTFNNWIFFTSFIGLVVILVISLLALVRTKELERKGQF